MKELIIIGILTPIFCLILVLSSTTKLAPKPTPFPPIVVPPQPEKILPGSKVEWFEFKTRKNLKDEKWGNYLTDIENHLDASKGTHYRDKDFNTWAHETTHGIHGWMNNKLQDKRTHYHLYVGYDKAVKIKQPNFKISDVAKMVPSSLQKNRYQLYLIKQQSGWNNEPIYLWDEWVAYCNGIEASIEMVNKKLFNPPKDSRTDSGWSVIEFGVYATYVAMAQKKHDPSYDNQQMMEFLAWNLERSMRLYKESQAIYYFTWDNNVYLNHLRTSEDAADFRQFIIDNYGKEWASKVFDF